VAYSLWRCFFYQASGFGLTITLKKKMAIVQQWRICGEKHLHMCQQSQVLCRKYQVITTPEQEVGTKSEYMVMAAVVLPQAASALQWKTSGSCYPFPLQAYETSETSDPKKKELRRAADLVTKELRSGFYELRKFVSLQSQRKSDSPNVKPM